MANKYDKIIWQAGKKLQAPELNEFQSIQGSKFDDAFIAIMGASKGVKNLTITPSTNSVSVTAMIFANGRFFNITNRVVSNLFTLTTNTTISIYVKIAETIINSTQDPDIAIPITKEETSLRLRYDITVEFGATVPLDIIDQPNGINVKYIPLVKAAGNKNINPTIDYTAYPVNIVQLGRDPILPMEPATKQYVDSFVQGLDTKGSVKVATINNISLSGVQNIDGIALAVGNRILVKDQTNKYDNGIYVVQNGAWTRSSDASTSAQVTSGMFTFVEEGTINGGGGFVLITPDPIVLGITQLTFSQFSGAGQIVAGTGIGKTGNMLYLKDTAVTPGTYKSVTVDQQGRITGGTNPTTLSGYGITDGVNISEVVTTATANKLLKLNGIGELPANAASATKLQTARTFNLSGDVTGSASFDGTNNTTITATYKDSGVVAGTYRSVTVNAKGMITAGTNPTTLSGYGITDGVNISEVVTSAAAGKLLKLDGNGKLPASITGDSDTVDGLHASAFMRTDVNTSSSGSITAGNGFYTANWYRSTGATGWYNETYGGGIHMQNSTWVEVYAGKSFYVPGVIKAGTGFVLPVGVNKWSTI